MTTRAAILGCLAGLFGAILPGWISGGSLMAGLEAASFPGSIPTLMPFVGALAGSGLVSLAIAVATPKR